MCDHYQTSAFCDILGPHFEDEGGDCVKGALSVILVYCVAASVVREVNGNEGVVSQALRSEHPLPDGI